MNQIWLLTISTCLLLSFVTPAQTYVFIVDAKQEWQATGITINSGESFTITGRGTYAEGSGGASGNPNAWASADGRGNGDFTAVTGLLAPNFNVAALIGKIGNNGEPFGIGSYAYKTATTSGELYLSINDKAGSFWDNYGYLVAIISAETITNLNQNSDKGNVPNETELYPNYPNPFNPITKINFQISEIQTIDLAIYDVNGHKIRDLISNKVYSPGSYNTIWDGTDNLSKRVSSGVYFYQLKGNDKALTKKMILLK